MQITKNNCTNNSQNQCEIASFGCDQYRKDRQISYMAYQDKSQNDAVRYQILVTTDPDSHRDPSWINSNVIIFGVRFL